uniref:Uncharacterized protein n=1 Tax=Panagrolaimus davidi TaxID=227884 RepID=A0A914QPM8_9BILA
MADEIYKALCPTSVREDKFVKSKNRQRNDLHKYIVILQRLDDTTAKPSSSTSTKSSASEMKNISTILFSNLHGIRVLDRAPNERVTTTSEHLIINDLKYSKKCVNYIQESAQINSFIDFLKIIFSIKECKNEIPKEIQKLKILNLCLKWWFNVISQIIPYTSVENLASDFIDVMEILQWFLKFDYLPTISFNKILAKHSLNEIVLTDEERDLYSVMDYYYTANDFDAFDSIIDKPFFSMLKFNHLFSGLPVGRCSKTIARDFINDNITTMEYLINPSEVSSFF